MEHCRSGNICVVLIFMNFARRKNLRITESGENYYYNSATDEKCKIFVKSPKIRKFKHANTTRSTVYKDHMRTWRVEGNQLMAISNYIYTCRYHNNLLAFNIYRFSKKYNIDYIYFAGKKNG